MSFLWRSMLPICLSVTLFHVNPTFAARTPSFSSAEHVAIGNNINLYFPNDDSGRMATPLPLPSGLNWTYGDIVSMGDFYGIIDQPISQGQTEIERRARFLAAFSTFAMNPNTVTEATQIINVIHTEGKMLEDGMKSGEKPEDIYKKIGREFDRQFNCITGGGCSPTTWWLEPGRYLQLENMNYDHFNDNAWVSYQTGHQIALEQAAAAHDTGDLKKLELAYAMNAFASHFLTDWFASGHMRTPRVELSREVSPSIVGSVLASYMHDEENEYSLHVHNLRGDHWIAYGDKSYFNSKSDDHRRILLETMQNSADQIFAAFQQGSPKVNDNVYHLIPRPDENANTTSLDVAPLFYWDSKRNKLMRRTDTTNLYDKHWTDDWWGWSTLLKLQSERGLSEEAQAMLAQSELSEKALQDGLITNKDIIAYIKKK